MGVSMRLILAICIVCSTALSAGSQTAEEAVAYVLFGQEERQILGVTTKKLSSSPAVFETKSDLFISRLTVSTTAKCRFKAIEDTKRADEPRTGNATLEFDFSAATPPARLATHTVGGVRQSLVQVVGLKLVNCSFKNLAPGVADNPDMEREMQKRACDGTRRGTSVLEQYYSTDRATKALNHVKANYC
jgi:hypothetical protein